MSVQNPSITTEATPGHDAGQAGSTAAPFDPSVLAPLFDPRSIAIVGASATPGKIGAMPLSLLLRHGYAGALYPVNPREAEIQGLRAYPSLDAIDAEIDLVILAVPAAHAVAALAKARPGQIRTAVVFTSGFAETGAAGAHEQARLQDVAHERGIRMLGPNCLGLMNPRRHVYATFSPAPMHDIVRPGGIAMVSQSGAFGAYAYTMARERGLGLSHWISTGNEGDIDTAACIAWLAHDADTRIIMLYMEGCQDGERFKAALAAARAAGKPIVVTKVGRTASGAQAAASHTAALAGDDAVYDALFRQYGVLRAQTIEEFFNLGYALSVLPARPHKRTLGVLTISGGVGALMADDAEDAGLAMPAMPEAAQQRLLARIPYAGPRNPVDVTGQAVSEQGLLEAAALDMLATEEYGALAIFLAAAGASAAMWPQFEAMARSLRTQYPATPLVLCSLFAPAHRQALESLGCLVFTDPSAAVRTVAAVMAPLEAARPGALAPAAAASSARAALRPGVSCAVAPAQDAQPLPLAGEGALSELQALAVLQQAGVPTVDVTLATDEDAAVRAGLALGGPAVLKIVSPDILHKSDIGGVKLGVQGESDLRAAYRAIRDAAATHAPQARVEGVLVAPLLKGGVECILGVHRDPIFGPVVMFGLGGIFVETLKDVSFRLAPFGHDEALAMIDEIQAAPLLRGARGAAASDRSALAAALVALSRFAHAQRDVIEGIDVNPLLVFEEGQGVAAVDAVIVRRAA